MKVLTFDFQGEEQIADGGWTLEPKGTSIVFSREIVLPEPSSNLDRYAVAVFPSCTIIAADSFLTVYKVSEDEVEGVVAMFRDEDDDDDINSTSFHPIPGGVLLAYEYGVARFDDEGNLVWHHSHDFGYFDGIEHGVVSFCQFGFSPTKFNIVSGKVVSQSI